MKKYIVEIKEVLTYRIEVEAESEDHAEDLAIVSDEFCTNLFIDNDAVVTTVEEVEEA